MSASEFVVGDRGVYLPADDALVVADVHLGRAHASNVEFPLNERRDTLDRLGTLLDRFDPETVVFAGDVLHRFDAVPVPVRESLDALVTSVRDADAEPILVRGNHDRQLDRVASAPVHDAYRLDSGTVVCHGHEEPPAGGERYIVGHDHPVLAVEGRRHPCLLYGPGAYDGHPVLMLPPFTTLAAGVVVNEMRAKDFDSPLVGRAGTFHPVVRDPDAGETLRFPPLGELRRVL
ncbi:metallophosphoesterase [Haloarchaeobius iranensis]|uniref:Putative phosphoesterase n=1 Tax=Haloarchaeobius iranensis TaxID=996166 RepID=A0A1G9T4C6_9EURY|nr:metallophosphoesterase [Haloarchaeobius iranensis]SDM42467.1 putative phosphoesterase [Haloarchaeobius iranensis]